MQDPIAERELKFRRAGSAVDEPVFVRVGRPVRSATMPQSWEIPYEIDGPGGHRYESRVYGGDAMQALGLVFGPLNALIDAIHRDGALTYEGSSAAARFPTT